MCVCVCMRASIKGGEGEGRRNGICAHKRHKRTSVIGILTASTNGESRGICGFLPVVQLVTKKGGGRWRVKSLENWRRDIFAIFKIIYFVFFKQICFQVIIPMPMDQCGIFKLLNENERARSIQSDSRGSSNYPEH